MPKIKLKPTYQALLDVANSEYEYLVNSKPEDGFDLGELEIFDRTCTDEEFQISFSLAMNGKTMVFAYSLGFDEDEGGYLPYVEVVVGDKHDPLQFETKCIGGDGYVAKKNDILESIQELSSVCGEVRFKAFQWLSTQDNEQSRG
jgi:hypothetical protein